MADDLGTLIQSYKTLLQSAYETCKSVALVPLDKDATAEDNDGWKYETTMDGIDIYFQKPKGESITTVKGIGMVKASPEIIAYMFACPHYRHLWDDSFSGGYRVCRIDETCDVNYAAFYAPWPVSGRDVVTVNGTAKLDDGSILLYATSCEHPRVPPVSNFVRADVHFNSVLLTPLSDGSGTRMSVSIRTDPKGQIPKWVLNANNLKQTSIIRNIANFVEQTKIHETLEHNMKLERAYEQAYWSKLRSQGVVYSPDEDLQEYKGPLVELLPIVVGKKVSHTGKESANTVMYASNEELSVDVDAEEVSYNSDEEEGADGEEKTNIITSVIVEHANEDDHDDPSHHTTPEQPVGAVEQKSKLNQDMYNISVAPLPPNKYDTLLKEGYELAWNAVSKNEDDGWKFHSEEEGIKIYMKPDPSGLPINFCKGIGIIPGTPEQIRAVFAASNIRVKWDEMYANGEVLERIDSNTVISYAAFKAPWPVAPRDFCSIGRSLVMEDGSILVYYTNFEHPNAPTPKKHVRGKLIFSSLYIKPLANNRSMVIYALGNDPAGKLPTGIINAANIKQPLCVAKIGKLIARDKASVIAALQEAKNTWQQVKHLAIAPSNTNTNTNTNTDANTSTSTNATTTTAAVSSARKGLNQAEYNISIAPLPPNKYDTLLKESYQTAWNAVSKNEDDGWKFHSEEEGIKIYMKPDPNGLPINFCKGIGIIPGTPEQIRAVFAASNIRVKWDDMYATGETVEQIDTNTVIAYAAFKAPWPVAPRDFCTLGRSIVLDDGSIFVYYVSVEDPRVPPVKKHVRGKVVYSALLIKSIGNNRCHVIYALGNDPAGKIPTSLVNAANIKQPLCVAKIGKLIARDKASVNLALSEARSIYESVSKSMAAKSASSSNSNDTSSSSGGNNGNNLTGPGGMHGTDLPQDQYHFSVGPLAPTKYDEELARILEVAWNAVSKNEDDGWKKELVEENIEIYMKTPPGSTLKYSKGIGLVSGTPQQIHVAFELDSCKSSWDEMYGNGETLERIDTNTVIAYAAFKAPWPITPRDFCTLGRSIALPDGSIFVYYGNYEHPKAPTPKKHVRGKLIFSALLIKPIQTTPPKCRVIYSTGSDLCGDIPVSIVNAANIKLPLCIAKVNKLLNNKPDIVRKGLSLMRDTYQTTLRRMHAGSEEDGTGSIDDPIDNTCSGVHPITWPSTLSEDTKWLEPLHVFAKKTTSEHWQDCQEYAKQHGGWFPQYKYSSTNTNTKDATETVGVPKSALPVGVLGLRMIKLRGNFVTSVGNLKTYCTVEYANQSKKTTLGPNFKLNSASTKDPNSNNYCFNITNPNDVLKITCWCETLDVLPVKTCLGQLTITIGELFEGNDGSGESGNGIGQGQVDKARRSWYAFSNIPVEIDRATTQFLMQYKSMSKEKLDELTDKQKEILSYLQDPPGLFICLESCVIINLIRMFTVEVRNESPILTPPSVLSSCDINLPTVLAQQPLQLISKDPTTSYIKNPELCEKVGYIANDVVSCGAESTLLLDDMEAYTDLTDTHVQNLVTLPNAYLCARNITRLLACLVPIMYFAQYTYDILLWKNFHASLVYFMTTLLLISYANYIPTIFFLVCGLFTVFTAANYHYKYAHERKSTSFYAFSKIRRAQVTLVLGDKLHTLLPELSSYAQAIVLCIQVLTGKLASLIERVQSLFYWTRGADTTACVSVLSFLLFICSLFCSTQTLVIIFTCLLLGWNSSVFIKLRALIGAFVRVQNIKQTIQMDSQLIRVIAIKPSSN